MQFSHSFFTASFWSPKISFMPCSQTPSVCSLLRVKYRVTNPYAYRKNNSCSLVMLQSVEFLYPPNTALLHDQPSTGPDRDEGPSRRQKNWSCAACSRLSHRDKRVWSNGGILICRGNLKELLAKPSMPFPPPWSRRGLKPMLCGNRLITPWPMSAGLSLSYLLIRLTKHSEFASKNKGDPQDATPRDNTLTVEINPLDGSHRRYVATSL
jgi:hypothetical protein